MAESLTVKWQGQRFEVERTEGRAAEPEAGPVWRVTREGALVTSFPADPDDAPGTVRDKVVAWLEANEARPTLDIGRQ